MESSGTACQVSIMSEMPHSSSGCLLRLLTVSMATPANIEWPHANGNLRFDNDMWLFWGSILEY